MANANKAKGDRYERHILTLAEAHGFVEARRTRAGRREDAGDIWLDQHPGAVIQVKDVATPDWRGWMSQLADQKAEAGTDIGFVAVKRRGSGGRPPLDLAVLPVSDMLRLLHDYKRLKEASQ